MITLVLSIVLCLTVDFQPVAGINAYISKPVRMEALEEVLAQLVGSAPSLANAMAAPTIDISNVAGTTCRL